MKEFDLEKAKSGAKVCTRDGKEARIICFDKVDETRPIVALVKVNSSFEEMRKFSNDGRSLVSFECADDLMLATEKQWAWVVVYRDRDTGEICSEIVKRAHMSRLRAHYHGDRTIAVRKIEWEE